MGLLKRIKGRVSSGVGLVKEGIQAINDEARHPGVAPSYREEADPNPPQREPETPESQRPVEEEAPGGGRFWFLDGENDGWEDTNPRGSEDQE